MLLSRHLFCRAATVRTIVPRISNSRDYSTRPLSVLLDIPALDNRKKFRPRSRRVPQSAPTKAASNIELFDAIVHEGVPLHKLRANVGEACVQPNGDSAPLRIDEKFASDLKIAHEEQDSDMAIQVLRQIEESGLKPTSAAYLRAVETCSATGSLDDAEDLLERHAPHIGKYERGVDVLRSARTSLALAYLAADNPKPALRVLRWTGPERLSDMELGKCEMAWGCVVRALTKSGDGAIAVDVARAAFDAGTPMTHALVFFMLEALRVCGRWRDADALLRAMQENKGDSGSSILNATEYSEERAVGSVLRTLTAPAARRFVDSKRVVELAFSITNPTSRFSTAALIALSSVGRTKEARQMYEALTKAVHPKSPDERSLSILIGGFCARIEAGPPDDADMSRWYSEICDEVDDLWGHYLQIIESSQSCSRREKEARSRAFQRVLWTKSRALRAAEAAELLTGAVMNKRRDLGVGTAHFAAVLSGTELTCDVETLRKVIDLMETEYVPHDPRTLAFGVGTLLGGGDLYGALALVQKHSNLFVRTSRIAEQRDYRVSLLVRRLDMLTDALAERHDLLAKNEMYELAEEFKRHLETHSGPTRGWR